MNSTQFERDPYKRALMTEYEKGREFVVTGRVYCARGDYDDPEFQRGMADALKMSKRKK